MKSEKRILIAFLLNILFAVFEFFGGLFTNSVAIISDSVHDAGDALSIAISYFLEKKSKQAPDETYTYGYLRYSVIGSVIITCILIVGSVFVIINAVDRLIHPQLVNYDGMIVLAVVGVIINALAVFFTRRGDSLNQRAVNLHMLEDVLGWAVVLVGAVVMHFTEFTWIDPLLSIGVTLFILFHAFSHLKEALDLFLVKVPHGIEVAEIKRRLKELDGVEDVHHIHAWSMDGHAHYATLHIVATGDLVTIKNAARELLLQCGVVHATLEMETKSEQCGEEYCHPSPTHEHCH